MPAPLLLAVETATATASVALWQGDALVGERLAPEGVATAEALLPAVDAVLVESGLALDRVDAFAVSIGPGSFTGLRIGVATVKGLAFGTGRPAVAVSTLEALASGLPVGAPVVAVLDARRGEVYAAGFDGSGARAAWLPEGVYPAEALVDRLPPGCRVVGEGVAVFADALRGAPQRDRVWIAPPEGAARAAHVAALGARALAAGRGVDPAELVPRYVRRAEAEVKRTGERFEPDPAGRAPTL